VRCMGLAADFPRMGNSYDGPARSRTTAPFVGTDALAILRELAHRRNADVPGTSALFYPSGGCVSSW